jgi:lysophospholipase L1-like esterase
LAELVDRTREQDVKVALVTHATRFGDSVVPEERPFLIAWRKFYPRLAEDAFLDMERRLNNVVRANAAERGLPLIDAAKEMEPGAKNFVEFVHFTDDGARRIAQIIADGIAPALAEHFHEHPDPAAKQVP